ncbi:MAG: DUF1292 domain-containing protein [Clostridia bacterium]|nr:DUF1292 domain-containing protein [Clostridia bacterium]
MNKDFEEKDFSMPDVVSVIDEEGNEHFFDELDRIETDDGKFVALIPVYEDAQDVIDDDGELIILEVQEENGETFLCPIENEKIFNEVGKIFEERLSEFYDFEE